MVKGLILIAARTELVKSCCFSFMGTTWLLMLYKCSFTYFPESFVFLGDNALLHIEITLSLFFFFYFEFWGQVVIVFNIYSNKCRVTTKRNLCCIKQNARYDDKYDLSFLGKNITIYSK
jgi:hypothetical protein